MNISMKFGWNKPISYWKILGLKILQPTDRQTDLLTLLLYIPKLSFGQALTIMKFKFVLGCLPLYTQW